MRDIDGRSASDFFRREILCDHLFDLFVMECIDYGTHGQLLTAQTCRCGAA
jgi:hypothetical protein